MTVDRWRFDQVKDDSLKNNVLIKWRFDQMTNDFLLTDDLLIDRWRFDQVTF